MAASQWVADVSEEDFQARVLDESRARPVVVDFWAPWCGPCRAIGPVLERLAEEAAGGFALAKVNVDSNPSLAGEFGVSGIPAVFAVRDGEVVDQFVGLLPEADLRRWVGRLAPSEADKLVAEGLAAEGGNRTAAEAAYRKVLDAAPAHEAARVGLARVLLQRPGREAEAADLLRGVEVGDQAAEADRLRRVLRVREVPHGDDDLEAARAAVAADGESADARHRLGAVLAARGDYSAALEELIAAAERDKKLAQTAVKELMVTVFHIIGVRSPEADAYRDRLRSLLY